MGREQRGSWGLASVPSRGTACCVPAQDPALLWARLPDYETGRWETGLGAAELPHGPS